jgi:hypothetical protein
MRRIGSGLDSVNFGQAPSSSFNDLTDVPDIVTQLVNGLITDNLQIDNLQINEVLTMLANSLLDHQGRDLHGVAPLALGAPGAVNNQALPTRNVWRITTDNGNNAFTGIAAPAAGEEERVIFLMNAGGTGTLTLEHQDAGSDAANRIIGANNADVIVRPGGGCVIRYDTTSTRWRVLSVL